MASGTAEPTSTAASTAPAKNVPDENPSDSPKKSPAPSNVYKLYVRWTGERHRLISTVNYETV